MNHRDMKKALREGQKMFGTFIIEFSAPSIVAVLAKAGCDFVIIDMEHSTFSMETVGKMIRTARGVDIPSVVRVPTIERFFISRALDAGASGLMIPRVESINDIENVVKYSMYPPEGDRGAAFGLSHNDYGDHRIIDGVNYTKQANDELLIIAQIETAKAIENIDELFSSGMFDVVLVGIYDLSTTLGVSGEFEHPIMVDAMEKVIEKAEEYNIIMGSYVDGFEGGKKWLERDIQLIACGSDVALLTWKVLEESQKFKNYWKTNA